MLGLAACSSVMTSGSPRCGTRCGQSMKPGIRLPEGVRCCTCCSSRQVQSALVCLAMALWAPLRPGDVPHINGFSMHF